jgi:hypothetical protein
MSLKNIVRMARMNSRITPKLNAWLVNNSNGVTIKKSDVADRVMKILRPSGVKSRAGAFHPSQLYQCPRAQVFGYYGAEGIKEYNPTLQNVFNDGHYRHLRWQIMLLEAGIITDIEVPVRIDKYRLEGSMDGMNSEEGWMFELKGTSQFGGVQTRGAMPAHIKQVHAYLLASGLDKAIIVYECKSTQQWVEIEINRDEKIIQEIEEILKELNDAIDKEKFPKILAECKDKTGAKFNSCQYSNICHGCNKPADIASVQAK